VCRFRLFGDRGAAAGPRFCSCHNGGGHDCPAGGGESKPKNSTGPAGLVGQRQRRAGSWNKNPDRQHRAIVFGVGQGARMWFAIGSAVETPRSGGRTSDKSSSPGPRPPTKTNGLHTAKFTECGVHGIPPDNGELGPLAQNPRSSGQKAEIFHLAFQEIQVPSNRLAKLCMPLFLVRCCTSGKSVRAPPGPAS